jgi:hypothetical protein
MAGRYGDKSAALLASTGRFAHDRRDSTADPQMANWLPEEEAAQLRFEFDVEMARLEAV